LLFAFTVWFLDNNPIGNKKSPLARALLL